MRPVQRWVGKYEGKGEIASVKCTVFMLVECVIILVLRDIFNSATISFIRDKGGEW